MHVWASKRKLAQSTGGSNKSVNAIAYVELKKMTADARKHHKDALNSIHTVWTRLLCGDVTLNEVVKNFDLINQVCSAVCP